MFKWALSLLFISYAKYAELLGLVPNARLRNKTIAVNLKADLYLTITKFIKRNLANTLYYVFLSPAGKIVNCGFVSFQ